jgi:hypothetical protein
MNTEEQALTSEQFVHREELRSWFIHALILHELLEEIHPCSCKHRTKTLKKHPLGICCCLETRAREKIEAYQPLLMSGGKDAPRSGKDKGAR